MKMGCSSRKLFIAVALSLVSTVCFAFNANHINIATNTASLHNRLKFNTRLISPFVLFSSTVGGYHDKNGQQQQQHNIDNLNPFIPVRHRSSQPEHLVTNNDISIHNNNNERKIKISYERNKKLLNDTITHTGIDNRPNNEVKAVVVSKDDNSDKSSLSSIWANRSVLFQMCRPSNIPGMIMFHMLSIFLVIRDTGVKVSYWKILLTEPTSWLIFASINLVAYTSMMVNDYYDAKLGRDNEKIITNNVEQKVNKNPIINGSIDQYTVRKVLAIMYGTALTITNFLPGIITRMSVTASLILTFLYTKHLKTKTFIKNIVCASIIAFSPWASGSATLHLLKSKAATSATSLSMLSVHSLWRLFTVLFCGISAREILMDCNDVKADASNNIRTVPVVYGQKFAINTAAILNIILSTVLLGPSIYSIIAKSATTVSILTPLRRLLIGGIACIIQQYRIYQISKKINNNNNNGDDTKSFIEKFVDELLLTNILGVASFL